MRTATTTNETTLNQTSSTHPTSTQTTATSNRGGIVRRRSSNKLLVAVTMLIMVLAGACGVQDVEPHAGARPAANATESDDIARLTNSDPTIHRREAPADEANPIEDDFWGDDYWDEDNNDDYSSDDYWDEEYDYTDDYTGDGGSEWASMEEFMIFVLIDIDRYWVETFEANGLAEPWVNYYFPAAGETSYSQCTDSFGNASLIDDNALFYCPVSDQIVISQQMAYNLWTGEMVGPDGQTVDGEIGDFAVAMLLAHEYGHQVQDELNLLGTASTPIMEQHADCLSGVWAASAERYGILDEGDIDEGLTAAWLLGDSYVDSADHHGTGEQRMDAFANGYQGATPAACDYLVPAGLV